MKPSTKAILCDPVLLRARDAHLRRLEALSAGRCPDRAFALCGINGSSQADGYSQPGQWVDEALDSLAEKAARLSDAAVFRPLCLEFDPYGVHFIDRMFGARVYRRDGQWWSDRLDRPVGRLAPPDLDADPTWRLARAIAEAFLAAGVTVPLFALPVIASPLNVALNLYGQEFLLTVSTDPPAARRDLAVINDLLCRLHRWYRARIAAAQLQATVAAGRCQPPGCGQLCGCSCHLLSAGQYAEFVAPLDEELLSVYPRGGMIHLCGVHTQHIPAWRQMRSLRAVQLNDRASEDLEVYFKELRGDQVIYLNLTATMTVERAMAVTGGRRLVIVAEVDEPPRAR